MKRGSIPSRYLGGTISHKRLGVSDCDGLVDRITDRIRALVARKLSYVGRVVLIKSVYNVLHNYWARIFILPKTVLSKIDSVSRRFLWHGNDVRDSPTLVAWADVCQPKKCGGLGFKDLHKWNLAALAKYVWWVESKADHLWVKWIYSIYLKGRNWQFYQPSSCSSWSWRKICYVKDQFWPLIGSCSDYAIKDG
ncbi:hypothetical protein RND81_06G020700 [Saponaria officinalis]|uniref:Uncharacterized protein n=1 Tax=Saponaria officinalis TaxID=3572 RepID=A0AAW1K6Q1_SAPOF